MPQNIPSAVVSTLGNNVVLYSSKLCLWCASYSVTGQRPCAILILSYLALSLCVLSYSASVESAEIKSLAKYRVRPKALAHNGHLFMW